MLVSHITSVRWAAYTTDPELRFGGWDSLRHSDYKIEYRRGLAKAEQRLTKLVSEGNLSSIDSVAQGLEKLANGRTDIYVDVEETLHAFMHKKNEAIAPMLSDALRQIKSEGLFEKYKYIVEEEFRSINIH